MIKAVIFDYNGILVNDAELHEYAYLKTAQELKIPMTLEKIKSFISLAPEKKIKKYFNATEDMAEKILQIKNKYYYKAAEKVNIVIEGVPEVLNYLSKKYTLALVSNTLGEYFNKSFPKNLASKFKETIFVDEIENPKPAPDALLKMAKKLGILKKECIYVGDSVTDSGTAKAAGIEYILIASGNEKKEDLLKEGELVLDNIRELMEVL